MPFRVLIVVFGLVALLFPVALLTEIFMVGRIGTVIADVARIRQAQLLAEGIERAQLDEQNGIQGYGTTGRGLFSAQYRQAHAEFTSLLAQLREHATALEPGEDAARLSADLDRIAALNLRWEREVAEPVLQGRLLVDAIAGTDPLIDAVRAVMHDTGRELARLGHDASLRRDRAVRAEGYLTRVTGVVAVAELAIFVYVLLRMGYELDRERGAIETLQTALISRLRPHPALDVGTAYFSATRGARVGGDMFDVYQLGADAALIVLGDVSGKGIEAAVDAAFIRYTLRAQAAADADPALIVERFNALYMNDKEPEAFVTLFVGVYDTRSGDLRYTNAGHEAAYVRRRGGVVERLLPTDPLVGLDPKASFSLAVSRLGPGETIVLATDGLTEARDRGRHFLAEGQVERWIASSPESSPQTLVEGVVRSLLEWTSGRQDDDLALLAVRPRGALPADG